MEHTKESKALQGGGSGIGFEEPRAIIHGEVPQRQEILARICHDLPTTGKNKLWSEALVHRCFVVNARSSPSPHVHEENKSSIRSQSSRNGSGCSSVSRSAARTHIKLIPGIPRSIEVAVTQWKDGDSSSVYPVHKFLCASFRKSKIPSYSNKSWVASGQKKALARFREVIQMLLSYLSENERPDICDFSDEHVWEAALGRFHRATDRNGKSESLSKLVGQWK